MQTQRAFFSTLDSDDRFHPQKLENELAVLKSTDAVCVFSRHLDCYPREKKMTLVPLWLYASSFWKVRLRIGQIPRDPLVRMSLVSKNHVCFDESLTLFEDWTFKYSILRYGDFRVLDSYGTLYFRHAKGLSSASMIKTCKGLMIAAKRDLRDAARIYGLIISLVSLGAFLFSTLLIKLSRRRVDPSKGEVLSVLANDLTG